MDLKEIEYLLQLARIEISDDEKKEIALQLRDILNFVEKLKEINTENIEPLAGGTCLKNIFRKDDKQAEEADEETKKNLKKMARKLSNDYFEIPPIFE